MKMRSDSNYSRFVQFVNYIRPIGLFSIEKLRKHIRRTAKHNEYQNLYLPQTNFWLPLTERCVLPIV